LKISSRGRRETEDKRELSSGGREEISSVILRNLLREGRLLEIIL
jgi:hypothetical protein